MSYKKNEFIRGISLIEIMATVAILGILSGVVVPKFADQIRKSNENDTKTSLLTLRSALLTYFSDNIGVDVSSITALVPRYINEVPSAKIGKYHSSTNNVIQRTTFTLIYADYGGWYYVTPSGVIYVNCTHTDTKGVYITNW